MKKLLILMLFLASPVWADCGDSTDEKGTIFNDCIKAAMNTDIGGQVEGDGSTYGIHLAELAYLKAIAFKLDEISKKLSGPEKYSSYETYTTADDGTVIKDSIMNFESELYAHSKACMHPKDGTWKKIKNAYGKTDEQITWYKPGCYSYREMPETIASVDDK